MGKTNPIENNLKKLTLLVDLTSKGDISRNSIGKELGVSHQTVWKYQKKLKLIQ